MPRSPTRERILDSAEVLFAEHGFAETSLRAITGRAGVNLAAVNYHFGTKESLIQAVFERFLDPFAVELEARLDATGEEELSLQSLLVLVSRAALGAHRGDARRLAILFRLSGLAYTQGQGHMRGFMRERYRGLFARFQRLLSVTVPEVPPAELFWRIHFAFGAAIFALSGMESLLAISHSDFGQSLTPEDVQARLLDFLACGIKAPVNAS